MLILTRKRNECIKIGDNILIKVVQTKSGLVKLGIEAPSEVRVLRAELAEFAPGSVASSSVHPEGSQGDHHELTMGEVAFQFGATFAADVEDQMLCVATD